MVPAQAELCMKSWLWQYSPDKAPNISLCLQIKDHFLPPLVMVLPVEHPAGKRRVAASDVAGLFGVARCSLDAAGDVGLHVPHPTPGEQPWSNLQ